MKTYRWFQFVYVAIMLNFLIPAISYIIDPAMAVQTMNDVNQLLGGGPWPLSEQTRLWHMLAVGNVMTLAFMCGLLLLDVVRFFPVLPALLFLKMFSSLFSLAIALNGGPVAFYAVFVLDGVTSVLMGVFAVKARAALLAMPPDDRPLPPWARLLLISPRRVQRRLDQLLARGVVDAVPRLDQVALGVARMLHRVMFRSDTVGLSKTFPVRQTARARLLQFRPLRFPFLVKERAIAPFDLSGLLSRRERIIRHLLGAHHDELQFVYDFELLASEEGALDELQARAEEVVAGGSPRAQWLQDLCVYEGYHRALLDALLRYRNGELAPPADADISLAGFLAWCRTHSTAMPA